MATSPLFGWEEPDDTDLVKDGAAAIRTLGNAIDTSMGDLLGGTTGQILSKASNTNMDFTWITNDVGDITEITASAPLTGGGTSGAVTVGIQDGTTAQKGAVQLENSTSSTSTTTAAVPAAVKSAYDLGAAAIPKSTVTTNGDIIYGTGSGTVTRLGIGSSGQALLVSGGVPAWGTVGAGANWSLLSSSALSGSSITISGISGKNKLLVLVENASTSTSGQSIGIRLNGTTDIYNHFGMQTIGSTTWNTQNLQGVAYLTNNNIQLGTMSNNAAGQVSGYLLIDGCNTSGVKTYNGVGSGNTGGGNGQYGYILGGWAATTSTISSIVITSPSGGTFDAGTIYVYSSVN